jgi:hypothetical protein
MPMRILLWLLAASLLSLELSAEEGTIIYEKGSGTYEIDLLDLALRHTIPEYGPYRLAQWDKSVTEARGNALLESGAFDITHRVMTSDLEKTMLVIPVELTRGIQGYRLILIHKDNLSRFAEVRTLDDLRTRFVAGFGSQWADLSVLQNNRFRVITAAETKLLYLMLEGKRFDYFPRGVNEIWDNIPQHIAEAPDMVVEPHIALYYPLVQFFVVARTNTALAARVRIGLERALADGSMKKLFLKYYEEIIRKARVEERRVFTLSNPSLPSSGPPDTGWWLGTSTGIPPSGND